MLYLNREYIWEVIYLVIPHSQPHYLINQTSTLCTSASIVFREEPELNNIVYSAEHWPQSLLKTGTEHWSSITNPDNIIVHVYNELARSLTRENWTHRSRCSIVQTSCLQVSLNSNKSLGRPIVFRLGLLVLLPKVCMQ